MHMLQNARNYKAVAVAVAVAIVVAVAASVLLLQLYIEKRKVDVAIENSDHGLNKWAFE